MDWAGLGAALEGELHRRPVIRKLYATDASEYQEMPAAVAVPRSERDVAVLVRFARRFGIGLIPRAAGTSLAGQVVGDGIVVDVSRHLTRILEIDAAGRRVRVQPGVIRNELNLALKPHGLLFGPETSTANRAMIGGMVGNNSCGSNSIVYGSTRDHLIRARGFLSDGSEATFGPLTAAEFAGKCAGPDGSLETRIYRHIRDLLSDPANRRTIAEHFPLPSIPRRNTGYSLDLVMDAEVFDPASPRPLNLCKLIAGSEGTLFFGVEFELDCDPLPPPHAALVCGHFASVNEALRANLVALRHHPSACELIDRHILECTKVNLEQRENRAFVQGDPGAILVVEIRRTTRPEAEAGVADLLADLGAAGLGYAFPVLWGSDAEKVWELRRAGQGVMSNVVGDAKPREVVEDTAVDVRDLPEYIEAFDALLRDKHGISCVYYAHAGSGELHTRPLFNLKTPEGLRTFRAVATDIARLVKKYRGSLSGEHGDGRLRGEFIRFMVSDACYEMMRGVKKAFDPQGIFNPGKIIDSPPMDTHLRHGPGAATPEYDTVLDFSDVLGIVRAAEKCNGSGDCRKTHLMGGTMCPSYMATRDEKDTTRARANILRHILTHPRDPKRAFDSDEIREVMDLCLSCKGCKRECPSNVDVGKMKAEFLQQLYDVRGVPWRSRLVANFASVAFLGSMAPWLYNAVYGRPWLRRWVNRLAGFHPERTMPLMPARTLRSWWRSRENLRPGSRRPSKGAVLVFADEFTNYQDVEAGIAAIELIEALGYEVEVPELMESGRAALSKGLLRQARDRAAFNTHYLSGFVSEERPLVGIEPSALLGFRDEYPDLLRGEAQSRARALAPHCLLLEEWIAREIDRGGITSESFTDERRLVRLHGHCHQKALSSMTPAVRALKLPRNYEVRLIPSGCCGMAGSFGYEAEHYEVSMKIGELVLFPAVRESAPDTLIAAAGTSCRHQIHDGTGRQALHPAQILRAALR